MAAFAVVFEAGLLRVSRRKHPSGASAVYVDAAYRSADQRTRWRPIIRTAEAGMRSRAFLRRRGSPPAMAPMRRELTARPAHPQVMTKPIAVPLMRGKALPTTARVVGNTGAMARPAINTRTAAAPGLLVRSMRNVVTAMAMEAAREIGRASCRERG